MTKTQRKKKIKHKDQRLAVKRSRAGLGLFAMVPIARDEFVIEYTGKILTNKEADKRGGRYLFDVNSKKTIDGTGYENLARYINHSCKPNCEVEIRNGKILIFAKRKIKAGEEFNYDYGKEYFDDFIKAYGCKCDSCLAKKHTR